MFTALRMEDKRCHIYISMKAKSATVLAIWWGLSVFGSSILQNSTLYDYERQAVSYIIASDGLGSGAARQSIAPTRYGSSWQYHPTGVVAGGWCSNY